MTGLRATEPKTPEFQARTARPYHHHRLPLPVSLQSLLCCSEAKCKHQRGERKARKGGAPGASRVHSKQIFKAGKRSHSNSSDLLTAQTGNDACGDQVAAAAAGWGSPEVPWRRSLPAAPPPSTLPLTGEASRAERCASGHSRSLTTDLGEREAAGAGVGVGWAIRAAWGSCLGR